MGYKRDKLILFFPPGSWDKGQTHNEKFREIRGFLSVWPAFKLYKKKIEKSVEIPTSRNERGRRERPKL